MPAEIQSIISQRRRIAALESQEKTIYVKNTWTPTFVGSTGAGTYTYTIQVGYWTRVGQLIFVRGRIGISAITGAPTGNMRIAGLPLNAVNIANLYGGVSWSDISNFNYSAGALALTGYISPNTNFIALSESFDNLPSVNAPAANFTNANIILTFRGEYQV